MVNFPKLLNLVFPRLISENVTLVSISGFLSILFKFGCSHSVSNIVTQLFYKLYDLYYSCGYFVHQKQFLATFERSQDFFFFNEHVTMATKFGRLVTYSEGLPFIKSHDTYNHVVLRDHMTN